DSAGKAPGGAACELPYHEGRDRSRPWPVGDPSGRPHSKDPAVPDVDDAGLIRRPSRAGGHKGRPYRPFPAPPSCSRDAPPPTMTGQGPTGKLRTPADAPGAVPPHGSPPSPHPPPSWHTGSP